MSCRIAFDVHQQQQRMHKLGPGTAIKAARCKAGERGRGQVNKACSTGSFKDRGGLTASRRPRTSAPGSNADRGNLAILAARWAGRVREACRPECDVIEALTLTVMRR